MNAGYADLLEQAEAKIRELLRQRHRYRGNIRFQFLIESAQLAGTGGLVGVFGDVVAASAVSQLGYWEPVISWPASLGGLGFSVEVRPVKRVSRPISSLATWF